MNNANNTELALTDTVRQKRIAKPITQLDPSPKPTTSKKKNSSIVATSSRGKKGTTSSKKKGTTTKDKPKLRTYDPDTCVRDCDDWRGENGRDYANAIRDEFGNGATKLLVPALCREKGIELPGLPDNFLVELYKHGDEHLVRITNAYDFSRYQGYKDGVSRVATNGRGGNEDDRGVVVQMLDVLKIMGFTLTDLDKDIVTETNNHVKSQMLKDPKRVIHLRYIGEGPKVSPNLTRKEVFNQYVSTSDEGGVYSKRVADHQDAIKAKEPASFHVTKDTPKKSLVGATNSKREAGEWVGSNDTSVRNALAKKGEKRIASTAFLISPNKAKVHHPLGLTPLGEELLKNVNKRKKKGAEKEDMDENLEPSDGPRPRRKCRGKY